MAKPRMWSVQWDSKIEERLIDLIENEAFQNIVNEFRRKKDAKNPKKITQTADAIIKQFRLDKRIFRVPVREYLLSKKILVSPYEGIHSKIKFGKDTMSIVIYPGATEREIKKMVHDWWYLMDWRFRMIAPEAKHFRKRSKREADRIIFQLYKDDVLKKDGEIVQDEAKKFLRGKGVRLINQNFVSINDFANAGIKLPKIERRKKIILRYTSKRQV